MPTWTLDVSLGLCLPAPLQVILPWIKISLVLPNEALWPSVEVRRCLGLRLPSYRMALPLMEPHLICGDGFSFQEIGPPSAPPKGIEGPYWKNSDPDEMQLLRTRGTSGVLRTHIHDIFGS